MNNDLTALRSVLMGKLKPWGNRDISQEKYRVEINSIETNTPQYEPRYDIEFFNARSPKAKYYKKFIDFECIKYLNTIKYLVESASDEDLKQYWITTTLTKKLHQFLTNMSKELFRLKYKMKDIDPSKKNQLLDKQRSEETFIIHYLKSKVIILYLEIQNMFKDSIEDELLVTSDLYELYFGETDNYSVIKELYGDDTPNKTNKKASPNSYFSLEYKHYNESPEKLTDSWDCLKLNGFIKSDTPIHVFKRVFSGKEISDKVVWSGTPTDLYYFFKLIYTDYKLITDMKLEQWKVLCMCFIKEDGTNFEFNKIRRLHKPNSTYKLIEKCVNHLR